MENNKNQPPAVESLEKPAAPPGGSQSQPSQSGGDQKKPDGDTRPPKGSLLRRILDWPYLYLAIFSVLIIILTASVLVLFKGHSSNSGKAKKASSLTSDELSQISGNTTLVGDSKQTLDIQGNAIFEGQILSRKDFNVAGSLKVGGSLSLPSIAVGGDASFGQIQDNGKLSVSGDAAIQGQLTVQKSLTVAGNGSFSGSLSAGQLSITSLQISGDLNISRHLGVNGPLPSRTPGPAIGAGGTVSINGSDTAGTITINTGSGTSAGVLLSVSFAIKFNSTPHIVISPVGQSAAGLQYYITRSNTGFTVSTLNAPPASTTFGFDYVAVD